MNQPVVLGVHPVRGWHGADEARQSLAVVCVWLLVLTPALLALHADVLMLVAAVTVGPPACYSAARVLRPHVRPDAEREARHWVAAVGTACGIPVVLALALQTGDAVFYLAAPAMLALAVSLPWAVVALVVRLCSALLSPRRPETPPPAAGAKWAPATFTVLPAGRR